MSNSVRKVVVASASANKAKRLETSAKTWGDLKSEISELLTGDLEAVVKPGNITLRGDDSVLPEGDFNVYLVATKNKAGGSVSVEAATDLGQQIAAAIVKAATLAQENQVEELKETLIETIADFFNVDTYDISPDSTSGDDELSEALKHAKSLS